MLLSIFIYSICNMYDNDILLIIINMNMNYEFMYSIIS